MKPAPRRGRPVLKRPTTDDNEAAHELAEAAQEFVDEIDATQPPAGFDVDFSDRPAQQEPVTYRWSIPGADGYVLQVSATFTPVFTDFIKYTNIDHARATAKPDIDRELTAVERNWIETTEPEVVLPTTAVTLEHATALYRNGQLSAENAGFADYREQCMFHDINPSDLGEFVDRTHESANTRIQAAEAEQAAARQALSNALQVLSADLAGVIDMTGFAPPPTVAPAEPSYAGLTIVPDVALVDAPNTYPRLAGANFIAQPPTEPLTEHEIAGYEILFERHGGIVEDWRLKKAGPADEAALRAITARIRAIVGSQIEKIVAEAPPVRVASQGGTGIPPAPKYMDDVPAWTEATPNTGIPPAPAHGGGWTIQP
jgi:hypothetical protein